MPANRNACLSTCLCAGELVFESSNCGRDTDEAFIQLLAHAAASANSGSGGSGGGAKGKGKGKGGTPAKPMGVADMARLSLAADDVAKVWRGGPRWGRLLRCCCVQAQASDPRAAPWTCSLHCPCIHLAWRRHSCIAARPAAQVTKDATTHLAWHPTTDTLIVACAGAGPQVGAGPSRQLGSALLPLVAACVLGAARSPGSAHRPLRHVLQGPWPAPSLPFLTPPCRQEGTCGPVARERGQLRAAALCPPLAAHPAARAQAGAAGRGAAGAGRGQRRRQAR